jgi:lysozyme
VKHPRVAVAALSLSAAAFGSLVLHEGYSPVAYRPVPGDVPTIGFGTTTGVKMGDTITPTTAVIRALQDVQKFEGAVKQCVRVPLHQHEYDAYIGLSYNIGSGAFCNSTLVRLLNQQEYRAACDQILRWDKFQGKPLRGLTLRRQDEHRKCIGEGA